MSRALHPALVVSLFLFFVNTPTAHAYLYCVPFHFLPCFQAALSDVLLVNLWRSDLGRNVASNVRTIKVKSALAMEQPCTHETHQIFILVLCVSLFLFWFLFLSVLVVLVSLLLSVSSLSWSLLLLLLACT